MLCKKPYTSQHGLAFPCGQCMPCRIRKRREWAHRIMLEASQYEDNAFVTLTYDDKEYDGRDLVPSHVQDFLKRLRASVAPVRIRFYLVGEYGDEGWRPHYHAALFNHPRCVRGRTRRSRGRVDWRGCCEVCRNVGDKWGYGDIELGILEAASAGYLARYVTKKLTRTDDARLDGRWPEFARMSNRPGIGHDVMFEVASVLMQFDADVKLVDVPNVLRSEGEEKPLGRYLRGKLREMIGKDKNAPEVSLEEYKAEMRELLEEAKNDPEVLTLKQAIVRRYGTKVASLEARTKIFKQRSSL